MCIVSIVVDCKCFNIVSTVVGCDIIGVCFIPLVFSKFSLDSFIVVYCGAVYSPHRILERRDTNALYLKCIMHFSL